MSGSTALSMLKSRTTEKMQGRIADRGYQPQRWWDIAKKQGQVVECSTVILRTISSIRVVISPLLTARRTAALPPV